MSDEAKIRIGYSSVGKILKEFGIEYQENKTKPIDLDPSNVSSTFYSFLQKNDLANGYRICRDSYDYDFIFSDGSILLFEMYLDLVGHIQKLYYLFLESPFVVSSYSEYLAYLGMTYSEVGEELLDDYYIEVDSIPKKKEFLRIHYDYFPSDYCELVHPASHIHIGNSEDVRIPVCGIFSPYEFACFCLKNAQFDRWKNAIVSEKFKEIVRVQKSNMCKLDQEMYSDNDKHEFYLS